MVHCNPFETLGLASRKSQQTLQNIYSRKDIASAVSFFRVDELTSGQVNSDRGKQRQSIRRQGNRRTLFDL